VKLNEIIGGILVVPTLTYLYTTETLTKTIFFIGCGIVYIGFVIAFAKYK